MNQRIVLGITGSIAAYKAAELTRLLIKAGCQVKVVMSEHAKQFVHPNTFAALTHERVFTDWFSAEEAMEHIALAKWADQVVIAPATAACISRLATGQADDLLTTLCLATRAPITIAPAMNQAMWHHVSVQRNVDVLKTMGYQLLPPDSGEQACGDVGDGRLPEPEQILQHILQRSIESKKRAGKLAGKKVLITAGPTQEALDPIRYITNHSSGKMGYALAAACHQQGASVCLISGPTLLSAPPGIDLVNIISAEAMYRAVMERIAETDIFIGCAAVADYRPLNTCATKIKKDPNTDTLTITLTKNPDIIRAVTARDNPPYTIGFAAETDQAHSHAQKKLQSKQVDLLVLNQVQPDGAPFYSDDNQATLFTRDGQINALAKISKVQLAEKIIAVCAEHFAVECSAALSESD